MWIYTVISQIFLNQILGILQRFATLGRSHNFAWNSLWSYRPRPPKVHPEACLIRVIFFHLGMVSLSPALPVEDRGQMLLLRQRQNNVLLCFPEPQGFAPESYPFEGWELALTSVGLRRHPMRPHSCRC